MVPLTSSLVPVPYTGEPGTSDLNRFRELVGTGNQSTIEIVVSCHDDIEPHSAPAAERLAEQARAAGWTACITYAVADLPDRYFGNGELAKLAHRVASAVVRLRRREGEVEARGFATWLAEDDKPWRFDHAYIALTRYGLRPGKTHAGILERINAA